MNATIYLFILVIFVFGAATSFFNETALFADRMPTSGSDASMTTANESILAMQKEAEHPSIFSSWSQLNIMWKTLWGGIVALFTLNFVLESYGIPTDITTLFLSPMALIIIYGAIEFWLGRRTQP